MGSIPSLNITIAATNAMSVAGPIMASDSSSALQLSGAQDMVARLHLIKKIPPTHQDSRPYEGTW